MQDMPLFMTDETWYYFDGKKYVLSEKAPQEAAESLREFYKNEKKMGYG